MTYIENIFLCMVSPLLVAALCMGRRQLRFFLFCFAGMGVCLLSAYINTFPASPTFWCDMLLTLAILGLLPATRKAVDA